VSVVPGHEIGRPVAAVEVDARDAQRLVGRRAGGEHHRVVELAQFLEFDLRAVVHVAEQPHPRLLQHSVQRIHDALDARVIRCHAVADQAERRRHAFEEVDTDLRLGLHECVHGVDPGGAGTDHGDAQGTGQRRLLNWLTATGHIQTR
jgi:hypothetical protein